MKKSMYLFSETWKQTIFEFFLKKVHFPLYNFKVHLCVALCYDYNLLLNRTCNKSGYIIVFQQVLKIISISTQFYHFRHNLHHTWTVRACATRRKQQQLCQEALINLYKSMHKYVNGHSNFGLIYLCLGLKQHRRQEASQSQRVKVYKVQSDKIIQL